MLCDVVGVGCVVFVYTYAYGKSSYKMTFLFVLLVSFCYNEVTFSIDELRFYRDSEKR